jgi:hypothetical protein
MKVKLGVAFVVLLFATLARADSTPITVDVTATAPGIDLSAVFTVEQVTGAFWDSGQQFLFTGTEYEVIGISGTLNGGAMTLDVPPQGIGSWMNGDNGQFNLGSVYFTANGSFSLLEWDQANNLLEIADANGDGYGSNNIIQWSAVDPPPAGVPEPSSLLLSGLGVALLCLFGKLKIHAANN